MIKKSITIGSGIENDYIVNTPFVSEVHCKIEEVDDDLYILTNYSPMGTYVNDKNVEDSQLLHLYDDVVVGETHVQWIHHFADGPEWPFQLGGVCAEPPTMRGNDTTAAGKIERFKEEYESVKKSTPQNDHPRLSPLQMKILRDGKER